MTKTSKEYKESVIVPALRLALVFFVVSFLWVFLFDRVLVWFSVESNSEGYWRLIELWLFVLLLGSVLFLLVKRVLKKNYLLNVSLSRSRSRYRTITEKTLTGIVIIDQKGIIRYVNPAFCRIFNYRPKEVLGQHFFLIVPPEERDQRNKLHHLFFYENHEVNGFYNVENKDGEGLVVYVDAVCIDSENGEKQQLMFMNDVSAQRNIENKLAESEKRYRVMMENLHDPVVIIDQNLHVSYANRAFREQFGDPPSDMNCCQFIFGDDRFCPFKKSQGRMVPEKYDFQLEDKRRGRIYQVTHIPLEDYENGFWGMTILHDLTEILQAQYKAEESDRLKSSFLANMSHEIRTPLNSILGFSGLLNDDQITAQERNSFVTLINQSGNQLLKVINDVIDYSFLESGSMKLSSERIVAEDLVEDLIKYAVKRKELYKKNKIKILSSVSVPDHLVFFSDLKRLKQVLFNLLDNALKFTDQGFVGLYMSFSQGKLIFMITDTGIGISREKQAVVFERFRQADEVLSRSFGGSGLGLSISKGLVEMMGGTIEMISYVGQGTHLEVRVPVLH